MGADGQYLRKTVQKMHKPKRNFARSTYHPEASSLRVNMNIVLLPVNNHFYGAASVYATEAARSKGIVYWNNFFQGRHVIIPITCFDKGNTSLGAPYFMKSDKEHKTRNASAGRNNQAKLEELLSTTKNVLKDVRPLPKSITPNLKGRLRKILPAELTETIETYFKAVSYETRQMDLPLNQNH
ncbi:hypothetical protein GF343_01100 [Candidatus Woesearchaeota archaeon]|nr:hypothetical protein [Candidatus Woesearchaeota archaeon]